MADTKSVAVTPIKVGLLVDYPTDDAAKNDMIDALRLVLDEAVDARRIDRPVEIVRRVVIGLPNGSYKAVERAYDELVDEGCLIVFGPYVSDNVVPLRSHVDKVAEVPIITLAGSDGALGEWCFALNNGSMSEEPVMLAAILRGDGRRRIAIAHEASLIGKEYLAHAESAYREAGLDIVCTVAIPQTDADKAEAVATIRASDPDALVHVGMGHGLWGFNTALTDASWNPPRYTTTAFEMAHINATWMTHLAGWIGLDSYDERNPVGQEFLRRFEARHGRWSGNFRACLGHDVGLTIARALADARPLTGLGVKEAVERVKMVPAASGAPGTRLRFGRYIRQGWMGADYLVARGVTEDATSHFFHTSPSEAEKKAAARS